jgi:RNA polymerase sigma-70 factor (ECF subfamily)
MSPQDVDALFRRFALRGDAEALGQVFDATWDELFRVALHFVERPDEAEDLVQATWLTAIEKAREPDPERRLMPWLIGVLALHARELRRKRRREIDPRRIEARSPEPSDARAESVELAAAVRDALGSVPESCRESLRRYLVDGRKAVEIALETGQRPATVRMQLHRGLEHLRKALPAGLALGGALALVPTRGVAAVREQVLARAAELALASAASTSGVLLGTTLLMKKLVVGIALLVLLVGFGAFLWPAPEPVDSASSAMLDERADTPDVARSNSAAPDSEALADRSAVPTAPANAQDDERERWDALLAGCSGRVLDAQGAPLAGLSVALVDVDIDDLWPPIDAVNPLRDVVRTDSEGRFTLRGARPAALHALAIDAGGPRATLRLVDAQLSPSEVMQIGDVQLAAGRPVSGEVQDIAGQPLANARVVALPNDFGVRAGPSVNGLNFLLRDLLGADPREELALGFASEKTPRTTVISFRGPVTNILQSPPFPTVFTDARGRFHFEALELGDVRLVATANEHAGGFLDIPGDRRDGGNVRVELAPLRDVAIRFVDASGAPREGVHVLARSGPLEEEAESVPVVFRRMPSSAADGSSTLRLSSDSSVATLFVRRNEHELWTLMGLDDFNGEQVLRLPAACAWSASVVDESGKPILAAQIELVTSEDARQPLRSGAHRVEATDGARYEVRGLTPGEYVAFVSAPGFVGSVRSVRLSSEPVMTEIQLERGGPLVVEVVDAASEQPVRDARVTLRVGRSFVGSASNYTDEHGRAELARWTSDAQDMLSVEVRHPSYARADAVKTASETAGLRVALEQGGRLEATLVGGAIDAIYTLGVARRDEQMHFVSIVEGAPAHVERLASGRWSYVVLPKLGHGDLVSNFLRRTPKPIAQGDFEVHSGEVAKLEIVGGGEVAAAAGLAGVLEAPAGLPSGNGAIRGSAFLDGEPAAGYAFTVIAPSGNAYIQIASAPVGADGRFEATRLPAGKLELALVRRGDEHRTTAWSGKRELGPGESATLDLVLASATLRVRVVDPSGAPVGGVSLTADSRVSDARAQLAQSGADGRATFRLFAEGETLITARHPSLGGASATVHAAPGRTLDPLELTLSAGVPCAGELRLESLQLVPDNDPLLIVGAPDRGHHVEHPLLNVEPPYRFRITGLEPGKYVAVLWTGAEMSKPTEFELGPGGDESLVLSLRR